jgi:hypothetical protein
LGSTRRKVRALDGALRSGAVWVVVPTLVTVCGVTNAPTSTPGPLAREHVGEAHLYSAVPHTVGLISAALTFGRSEGAHPCHQLLGSVWECVRNNRRVQKAANPRLVFVVQAHLLADRDSQARQAKVTRVERAPNTKRTEKPLQLLLLLSLETKHQITRHKQAPWLL